jgi:superoxide dismutase, Cu-Zn family
MNQPFRPAAILLAATTALATFITGCATTGGDDHGGHDHNHGFEGVKQLVATIQPTAGNKCAGFVRFIEVGHVVYVYAEISGLTPNEKHAMHIHEFGDGTSNDGMRAGGHYNPEDKAHGLPGTGERHAGDLGNLQADASGKAVYRGEFNDLSMVGVKNPIVGRGVIIHAKPDDGGQPVGNAGARIGFGVIGVGNPKQ